MCHAEEKFHPVVIKQYSSFLLVYGKVGGAAKYGGPPNMVGWQGWKL